MSEDIGAQLVLGDRPIEITVRGWLLVQCFYPSNSFCTIMLDCELCKILVATISEAHVRLFLQLERAWKSLTWDQKTKLVISLFRGITSTTDTPVSTSIHTFSHTYCRKQWFFSVLFVQEDVSTRYNVLESNVEESTDTVVVC